MKKHFIFLSLSLCCLAPTPGWGMGAPYVDPADAEVNDHKPKSGDTNALAKCQKLSARATRLGLNTLVIAFEGLASYDASGTSAAYRAQWLAQSGQAAEWPRASNGGYVLHGLLVPFLQRDARAFESLILPYDSVADGNGGVAEACAWAWLKDSRAPKRRLVIAGHSYGGHAANQLATRLQALNLRIDAVVSIDPRTRGYVGNLGRTSNAERWENFYQTNTPFLSGYTVPGADLNQNLSSTGIGHTQMPRAQAVHEALRRALRD